MGDAYCRTRNPLSQILHNPPMPLGLPELAFRAGGFLHRGIPLGHTACAASRVRECTRGCLPQRCLRCGAVNIEGLSAARRFAVRSSWMSRGCFPQGLSRCRSRERRDRGAICYKAFHVAESAVTGAACFCKRLGAGERVPHGVGSDGPARFWGQETVLSARVSQDGVPILGDAKRRRCA